VKVEEVATTGEFPSGAQTLRPESEVITRVELANPGEAAVTVPVETWRLRVVGPGGAAAEAPPLLASEAPPRFGGSSPQPIAPVVLGPQQKLTLSLVFRGFPDVPADGALALHLETGGATSPLALAAPAAPSPRWLLHGAVNGAVGFGFQRVIGSGSVRNSALLEMFLEFGRLVVGHEITLGRFAYDDDAERRAGQHTASINSRIGWALPYSLLLLAGCDFVFIGRPDHPEVDQLAWTAPNLGVRVVLGESRPALSPLPLWRPRPVLGPTWAELRYQHGFGHNGFDRAPALVAVAGFDFLHH
jgi:hypothetical protein